MTEFQVLGQRMLKLTILYKLLITFINLGFLSSHNIHINKLDCSNNHDSGACYHCHKYNIKDNHEKDNLQILQIKNGVLKSQCCNIKNL